MRLLLTCIFMEVGMRIIFDKLYRYDRVQEPCSIAIPVGQGVLWSADGVRIRDGERILPSQTKVTSRHRDGSVRWLFTRFLANLPGNARKELDCELECGETCDFSGIRTERFPDGWKAECGALRFVLKNHSRNLFQSLEDGSRVYAAEQFVGPVLSTKEAEYEAVFREWNMVEQGAVCVIFEAEAACCPRGESEIPLNTPRLECRITAYAHKPWLEIACRLINATDRELQPISLVFAVKRDVEAAYNPVIERGEGGRMTEEESALARTGMEEAAGEDVGQITAGECAGQKAAGECVEREAAEECTGWREDRKCAGQEAAGRLCRTVGVKELPRLQEELDLDSVRTCVGRSNYKTSFLLGSGGRRVSTVADAGLLLNEANEHFGEVFYGTFFGDVTDTRGGVCATVFQAQQNFPKAITADGSGVYVMLVPEGVDRVAMAPGMSREQRFQLHFHSAGESLLEIDNRSLIYQMPDMPRLKPEVYREAGVMPDIFVDADAMDADVEIALVNRADAHARCYGMMNWGDVPDAGYTDQGRGKGRLVWTNNEYDYPHAMYLMYARTGVRRFLDYANVAAGHWMDVDVCHHSANSLHVGGQWEHTFGHCGGGVMVCSHQWVEGLLDCYHFTGNERALRTAVGIGENILRLLETPMYQKSGESNARETGWALRTLTALYAETWEERWTAKCRWIVGHFREWQEEYGGWLAPYTDNTMVRTGFMISVAVGSLMRYYRVFPREDVRDLMLNAIDDLVENCLMENGLFYYKELPSLSRNGGNTLLLEAMAIGYELTGDRKYLEYGRKTFETGIRGGGGQGSGRKQVVEDTVISGSGGTKSFAQSFLPLTTYYKALTECRRKNRPDAGPGGLLSMDAR